MKQIKSHTGLRGIAALLVVLYHLQFLDGHLAIEDATQIPRRAYLMVDLFFVLSGFIISYVYSPKSNQNLDNWLFFLRRIVRLYPLHLFCLGYLVIGQIVLSLARSKAGHGPSGLFVDANLLSLGLQIPLLQAFSMAKVGWNVPTWSISAELFAYALFPTMVALLDRHRILATVVFLFASAAFYSIVSSPKGSLDVIIWPAPLRCLAGFMLGMLVHQWRGAVATLNARLIGIAQAVVVAGIFVVLAVSVRDVIAIPLFVALTALTCSDRGWVGRVLSRRVFQYLGEISYSVYLNHVCIIALAYPVWAAIAKRAGVPAVLDRTIWLMLAFSTVIGISHMTYHLVEIPARRMLTRKLKL